jgi:hypothetical protein
VQHHRLGKPEVRRLYQALQVYSLGFHQAMLELTRHASGKGLLLLAIWRGSAMLWDGALQVGVGAPVGGGQAQSQGPEQCVEGPPSTLAHRRLNWALLHSCRRSFSQLRRCRPAGSGRRRC